MPTSPNTTARPPSAHLLQRFDVNGPRYTSYPTADRFVEAFTEQDYLRALCQRQAGTGTANRPLSIYVHVPFCESLCYYCACNKVITKHHERADEYLDYLAKELDLITGQFQTSAQTGVTEKPQVSQLHLGGGSPTFLDDRQLSRLMELLQQHFRFTKAAECSIEVDPRTIDTRRLAHLRALGFNRISLGVQDFDTEVQKAVHRIQSTEQVFELVAAARQLGFDSVNVDLIYGLPRQTPASFATTLEQVCALRPDRIALYAYAHLPERFKPQRRIDALALPKAADKVGMLAQALEAFNNAGYVDIGMDHFALPQDSLAQAKRSGLLHRNFQGYSTQADTDLIGLGVSAISKVGPTYSQNDRQLANYYDTLDHGRLPIIHGLALSKDDLMRRSIIMALMCQGLVSFESIELSYLIDFRTEFAQELAVLANYEANGLVHINDQSIEVTELGWTFVRGIAMVFDRYLQSDRNRARFSKIL
ncbi:oxygen-independent coproporphyrinogen III oxidase [Corticibacter populi]|uniref:Coproporphyrinogen-III oxidase n=1 Tax=Corticibacter populi TaxID=1550736 RepID=A0A3M6QXI4_9BURK|nr:oxygen-independent coproporphyrinogen III oxidase [Corticibacter populi]RMX07684.1 oxygen-independent coproporphyrinogen III oxidase [Corticibacter populi]RZS30192.1 oxygen-independent coproporphyrinogen-3 oxidase [Corticibacter populi]